MGEPLPDTDSPVAPRPRTALTLLRDLVMGALGGIVLGLAGLLLLWMVGESGSSAPASGCLLLLAGVALLILGGLAGYWVTGEPIGAYVGAITLFLMPFIVYGIRVQLTVGWRAWLTSKKPTKAPRRDSDSDR
jgi:hypothetical protein